MAQTKEDKLKRQFNSPKGFFFTALIMWVIGYVLVSLAIDSGSMLQWLAALVAAVWGLVRFIQAVKLQLAQKK